MNPLRDRSPSEAWALIPSAIFFYLTGLITLSKMFAILALPGYRPGLHLALLAMASSYREIALAFLVSAMCCGFLLAARRRPGVRPFIVCLSLLCAFVMALINLSNAELLSRVGVPLSATLLLLSDLFGSAHGRAALLSWVPVSAIVLLLSACLLVSLVLYGQRLAMKFMSGRTMLAVATCCVLAVVAAGRSIYPLPRPFMQSGTATFAYSLRLLDPDIPPGTRLGTPPFPPGIMRPGAPLKPGGKPVRNVVLIVLESAGALYFDQYGGRYGITPALNGEAGNALVVTNAYAHAMTSTQSLESILTSRYPFVSYRPAFERIDDAARVEPLPDILAGAGLRTAFFHSSDTGFKNAQRTLVRSGFGKVSNGINRQCDRRLAFKGTVLGNPDRCTFDEIRQWIESRPQTPFFAALWTFQSHYPYYESRRTIADLRGETLPNADVRRQKMRYLNTLAEADALIGELIAWLKQRGLYDETLIIVTGDHGQAFGQHDTFAHGIWPFEESVRVPLVLLSPALARSEAFTRVSGHIDIAPTIADALGLGAPRSWEGTSLFEPARDRPVYFTSFWADISIGYRFGNRKVVSNLLTGTTQIHDLDRDPHEQRDLAPLLPQEDIHRQQTWLRQWAVDTNRRWSAFFREKP